MIFYKKYTTDKNLINVRLGQGQYRNELLQLYNYKCPLTNITNPDLLIASHIKPWKDANSDERLDPYNGFILAVNYDKVFDNGYIFFDDGKIMISSKLTPNDISKLAINKNSKIKLYEENKKYLKYHRDNIFQK